MTWFINNIQEGVEFEIKPSYIADYPVEYCKNIVASTVTPGVSQFQSLSHVRL
jgi:hypothetical protein